jgi:hypothetical protein
MSESKRILEQARILVASGWCNSAAKDVSGKDVLPEDVSARRFGLLGALLRVTTPYAPGVGLRLKNRGRSFESALKRLGRVISNGDQSQQTDIIDLIDQRDRDKRTALRMLDRAIQG